MKQILLEIDDRLAERLESLAPARSRKRSEFLRRAIQEAIWALEEAATREAYLRQPDAGESRGLDPRAWSPGGWEPSSRPRSKGPRRKR
jgi:predicted transcriptional regulator